MNKLSSTEYRKMTRKERKAFLKSGGKIVWTAKDALGAVFSVAALAGVLWFVGQGEVAPDYEKNAKARCLSEAVIGVKGLKPDYSSVVAMKENPRYKVWFNFTAPNGLGQQVPGKAYCETDLTGQAVLLINVARR